MTERLCINCKHYFASGYCRALVGRPSPHDGKTLGERDLFAAMMMRMTLCGWSDPKLWEPK